MDKIKFYKYDGSLEREELLNDYSLAGTNGMLLKCHMNDGTTEVGYSDPYRTHSQEEYDGEVHDYIYLWTWDNLDEETHQLIGDNDTKFNQTFKKITIKKINSIDAILYSNPRWGGKLTNKFEFHHQEKPVELTEVVIPAFLKKYDNPEFEYKDDKYDIIGFIANYREMEQYDIKEIFGDKDDGQFWIFNINDDLICFCNTGNYHLDSYSAIIENDYMHIVTDFEYYKLNLKTLKSEVSIELDSSPCDEIYRFNKGYVVIGEMDITYIENDSIKWEYSSSGVIESAIVCPDNTIRVREDEPYKKFVLNADGKIM